MSSKIYLNKTKAGKEGKDGDVAYATISGEFFTITGIRLRKKGDNKYVFFPEKEDSKNKAEEKTDEQKEKKDKHVVYLTDASEDKEVWKQKVAQKQAAFNNMLWALYDSGETEKEIKLDDKLGRVVVNMWPKPTGARVGSATVTVGSFCFRFMDVFKSPKIKENNEKHGRPELRDYMVANYRISEKNKDGEYETKDVFYFKGAKALEVQKAIVAAIPEQTATKATPKKEEPEMADDDLPF
jgi:uncharacterized FlaG/YvyC family protein